MTTTATQRIARGFFVLSVVFITAVFGYRFLFNMDWLSATWMSVITISTTGFAEKSVMEPSFQLFTICVVVFGVFGTAYAFTGLVQLLLAGELDRFYGKRKMEREIGKLTGHVVVCGYGRLGHTLVNDLAHEGQPLVVIESDTAKAQQAEIEGHLILEGDATEEEILLKAGLERASCLVTTLPSDAANVFITLSARDINKQAQILSLIHI